MMRETSRPLASRGRVIIRMILSDDSRGARIATCQDSWSRRKRSKLCTRTATRPLCESRSTAAPARSGWSSRSSASPLAARSRARSTEPSRSSTSPPDREPCSSRATRPAGSERRFRYLADHEVGSHDVTQFLGVIDPSRAPDHGHVYDEVIYVVEGEGTLHLDGMDTPIGPGSCIHLPPLVEHCLENHGPGPMRVLGVFHPAGDPAGRA